MASSEAQKEFDDLMRDKGRRERHPEDDNDSDATYGEPQQSNDVLKEQAMPRSSMTASRDMIPRTKYGANTGPKGVISDAQSFQASRRVHRTAARASMTLPPQPEPTITFGQQIRAERLAEAEEQGDVEEDDEDDDEMDDEFMAQWRQQRLQAMQKGSYSSTMHSRGTQSKIYGTIATVDGEGYLEAVEGSGTDTIVVVFIYDDTSEVCQLFEACLKTLASQHRKTRFVRLSYEEAEIEAAGVPGLIAYRGGEKFAALIPLIDEMPDDGDLDAETLEKVLQKHQILR